VNCLEGMCCKSSWHYCSVVDLLHDKIKTGLSWYTAKEFIAVP